MNFPGTRYPRILPYLLGALAILGFLIALAGSVWCLVPFALVYAVVLGYWWVMGRRTGPQR